MGDYPTTPRGVLLVAALLAFAIVVVYASSMATIGMGAAIIALVAYVVYIVGYRINDVLKHGL